MATILLDELNGLFQSLNVILQIDILNIEAVPDELLSTDENFKCCVQNVVSLGCRYNNSIGSGDNVPLSA